MNAVSLDGWLSDCRSRVDQALDKALPPPTEAPRPLHEAMRYAVLTPGKRLRPALAFGAAAACGGEPEQVLPVACAVEMVHAYSLVHDDLPAMDDDAERHGRPSVHVRFGEANAILAGDALLALAFAQLARDDVSSDVVARLAHVAGSRELVGGQVDDLALDPARAERAQILAIHRRKTAALFGFAVWGAARLCGASAEERAGLAHFAEHTGLAFQAVDDLLDRDREECSLLRVMSEPEVRARIETRIARAIERLEPFGERAEALRGLAESLVGRLP